MEHNKQLTEELELLEEIQRKVVAIIATTRERLREAAV
jgi:hypothetical protein